MHKGGRGSVGGSSAGSCWGRQCEWADHACCRAVATAAVATFAASRACRRCGQLHSCYRSSWSRQLTAWRPCAADLCNVMLMWRNTGRSCMSRQSSALCLSVAAINVNQCLYVSCCMVLRWKASHMRQRACFRLHLSYATAEVPLVVKACQPRVLLSTRDGGAIESNNPQECLLLQCFSYVKVIRGQQPYMSLLLNTSYHWCPVLAPQQATPQAHAAAAAGWAPAHAASTASCAQRPRWERLQQLTYVHMSQLCCH